MEKGGKTNSVHFLYWLNFPLVPCLLFHACFSPRPLSENVFSLLVLHPMFDVEKLILEAHRRGDLSQVV